MNTDQVKSPNDARETYNRIYGSYESAGLAARRLKMFRLQHCMSQREMASALGCAQSSLQNYEAGLKVPGDVNAASIERVAGISVDAWDRD